ncbi:hypothetical protein Taro_021755, partial [Colocasia esculenta]|nr:hypothetical protein [Colocasia esculenta]
VRSTRLGFSSFVPFRCCRNPLSPSSLLLPLLRRPGTDEEEVKNSGAGGTASLCIPPRFGWSPRSALGDLRLSEVANCSGRLSQFFDSLRKLFQHRSIISAMVGDTIMNNISNGSVNQQSPQRSFQVVVAATRSGGIGKDGKLPWNLPSDLKFFKEITTTTSDSVKKNAVIMGRKTWESIPLENRPLPSRLNVVLTRSGSFDIATAENVVICGSMKSALELLAGSPYCLSIDKVFVIGGGEVLREALNAPGCEAIHLTDIEADIESDTFLPPIDVSLFQPWYSSFPRVENNIRHCFVTYARVRSSVADCHSLQNGESTDGNLNNDKFEVERFSFLPRMIFERHGEYEYLRLVQDILSNGIQKNDRTGTGTLSLFGCQMRFNLRRSFPLLTTKYFGAVLLKNSCGSLVVQQMQRYIGMHGDYSGKGFDQLLDVINKIKNNPDDRRIILSAWNPSDVKLMALPPCHMFAQFYVANGELSCQMYQRSADMGLGVPFNIASYSLLTCMIAQVCGMFYFIYVLVSLSSVQTT